MAERNRGEPVDGQWQLDPGQHPFQDNYSWTDEQGHLRCGRYSSKRRGSCDTRLDEQGECARQGDHGWSNEVRGS